MGQQVGKCGWSLVFESTACGPRGGRGLEDAAPATRSRDSARKPCLREPQDSVLAAAASAAAAAASALAFLAATLMARRSALAALASAGVDLPAGNRSFRRTALPDRSRR